MFSTVVVALAIAGHAESAIDHLQLLQQKMVLAPEKQWKRMRAAEPLNWIHFPKLGGPLRCFVTSGVVPKVLPMDHGEKSC